MKYISIELHQLKAFSYISGIETLKLDTEAMVQLILGTNGSGKSSLLRECSPLPGNRSDYFDTGYKKVELSHGGSLYLLTSDFRNKSHAHSFIKDGEELNESGTTSVQEDLVRSHLGYTKRIEDLVVGKYKITQMSPGQRKNLLMMINPYSLEFMLDYHKNISSQIRSCKSNLTHLYEREVELSSELLKEEDLNELLEERESLDDPLKEVIRYGYQLEEKIRSLENVSSVQFDIDSYLSNILKYQKELANFSDIPRDDLQSVREAAKSRIDILSANEVSVGDQISSLVEEIDKYQGILNDLKDQADSTELENTLETLQSEIVKKKEATVPNPYTRDLMDTLFSRIEKIADITSFFLGISTKLLPSSKVRSKKNSLFKRSEQLRILDGQVEYYRNQISELDRDLDISMDDLPKTNCSKEICPLYSAFVLKHDVVYDKLSKAREALRKIEHKRKRRSSYVEGLSEQLREQEPYIPRITELVTILREHPDLKEHVKEYNILHVLQTNPTLISRVLFDHYDRSKITHEVEDLQSEYLKKLELQKELAKTDTSELSFTENLITEMSSKLAGLRFKQDTISEDIAHATSFHKRILRYQELINWVESQKRNLDEQYEQSRKAHERDLYVELLEINKEAKDHYVRRISTIDNTLRQQEILSAKYTDEIKIQIGKIDARRKKLELVEKALSPKDGIPHKYNVSFINSLIERMNYYIDLVFSYPFEVVPVDPHDPLDYKFQAQAGDVIIPDISLCSDAQAEMMNLAFMLSVIHHLNLSDYPISLDEIGKGFDHYHKQNLLTLFTEVIEHDLVSQIFIINHHSAIWSGLSNSDILVLSDKNIMTPTDYNNHVEITKYTNT